MADFITVAKGLPLLSGVADITIEGITERVVMDLIGRHRWPFLLEAQREISWAASDSIQAFPNIARVWNIMITDSNGDYYRLTELSDIEFQKWIENYPDEDEAQVWRDAGMDGNDYQIEIYAAPTTAKTLKVDYTAMPSSGDVDDLPARFQSLILLGVQAMARPETAFLMRNYEVAVQEAIARETDMQGRRQAVGMDTLQATRMRNINDPT